jgi:hypothetical protein
MTSRKTEFRQVSFYTRATFLKKLCKSHTEFPFNAVYFLGVRGLTIPTYIVYEFTTSGHTDLHSIYVLSIPYIYIYIYTHTFIYRTHKFLH